MSAKQRRCRLFRVLIGTCVVLAPVARAVLAEPPADPLAEARSLLETGRWEEGSAILARFLESGPTDPDALARAAILLRDMRRFDEAVTTARRAVELRPEDPTLRLELARALVDAGYQNQAADRKQERFSEAAVAYAAAAAGDPSSIGAVAGWAEALGLAGRHGEAIPVLERLIELDPDGEGGYVRLAERLGALKRWDEIPAVARRATNRGAGLGWKVALRIYDVASTEAEYKAADSLLPILRATVPGAAGERGVSALETIAQGQYDRALAWTVGCIAASSEPDEAEIVYNAVVSRGLKDLPPPKRPADRRKVSSETGELTLPEIVRKVDPFYPPGLLSSGVEGKVILQAVLRTDGTIGRIRFLRYDDPLFAVAALDAVKRWHYLPALMDGHPVEIYYTIRVEFTPPSMLRPKKRKGE